MANIAPIPVQAQPAPQSTQAASTSSGSDTEFGTILSETVSGQQNNSSTDANAADDQQQQHEKPPTDLSQKDSTKQTPPNSSSDLQSGTPQEISQVIAGQLPANHLQTVNELTFQFHKSPKGDGIFTEVGKNGSAQPFTTPATATMPNEAVAGILATLTDGNSAQQIGPAASSTPIMSTQLQQLIDNNETKGITITQQPANPSTLKSLQNHNPILVAAEAESSGTPQVQISQTSGTDTLSGNIGQITAAPDISPDRSATKLAPLRQDIQGQYIEAKLEAQDKNTGNQNQQTAQQDGSENPQSTLSSQPTNGFNNEQTSTYSQVSQVIQDNKLSQPATATASPITLPSGTTVSEESVIQQVAERFQIQARRQETQLSIKLHPAELGELKIDLTLKEGAIRANVFAQSQQAQEILEKNLPRLKAVLESQGFQIEEILISSEADSVGEFDLFREQLSQGGNYTPQESQNIDTTSFNQTLENATIADPGPTIGVNVQA